MTTNKQKPGIGGWLIQMLAAVLMLVAVAAAGTRAQAQGVPVAVNTPETVTGDIVPGMTELEIPFTLSGADGVKLDLIVPVDGAKLTLISPSGAVALAPGDPRVEYNPGSGLTPPLPGGVFVTPELAGPENGTWVIRLAFPAAPTKTIALGTILARSRYQVGIAIERNTFLVGEDVSVGMIVLDNGVPITGLAPTIGIGLGAPGTPTPAIDNGTGPDGLANDGVYSVDYTFGTAGTYQILGTVTIPTPGGPVIRKATATAQAVEPLLNVTGISLTKAVGTGGCVSGLQVVLNFNVLKAATYALHVQLGTANGKSLDFRRSQAVGVGAGTATVVFSAQDIKQTLGVDGPFTVKLIEALEIGANDFVLAYKKQGAGTFDVKLAELCAAPIELQEQLTVAPVLKQGYIGSLNMAFPVRVRSAGFYQISFKVIGAKGDDIALVNASRSLAAGVNNVMVNVASDKFLTVDGPYKVISLLVLGGGNSARLSTMGTTPGYLRWQFYPKITGDLSGDGAVDAADVTLVTQFRGAKVLVPGDRRDLNKDGVIDIRDARELQNLRCTMGTCPVNP